jgi:hypothetical protein
MPFVQQESNKVYPHKSGTAGYQKTFLFLVHRELSCVKTGMVIEIS